jgi:FkbM family methyltransferase
MTPSSNPLVRFASLSAKAVYWLVNDPRKALFLVRRRLWPMLYPIVRRLEEADPPGRGVFVDCGSNFGQGIAYFEKLYPPDRFDYILIEPNPACQPALQQAAARLESRGARVTVLQQAAWDTKEMLTLAIPSPEEDPTALGSSVIPEEGQDLETMEVQGIDMGSVIGALYGTYSHLVMKMDIEGAELNVIPRVYQMANDIKHRLVIYVEFHSYYQEGDRKQASLVAEGDIVRSRPENVILREWH